MVKLRTVSVQTPDGAVHRKRGHAPPQYAIIARVHEVDPVWETTRKMTFLGLEDVKVMVGQRRVRGARPKWSPIGWFDSEDRAHAALGQYMHEKEQYETPRIMRARQE